MKSRNALTVILAALMVFTLAYSAEARPFGLGFAHGDPGGALGGLQTLLALKLTDAQQEQLSSIIAKYQDQVRELRSEMRQTQRNTWEVLNATPFDEGNARKAFRTASNVREEMFILRAKMMAELKSVLTAEQLSQLNERKAHKFRAIEQGPNPGAQNPSE
jgi:Spy/CpxP family protein refolding chaperone